VNELTLGAIMKIPIYINGLLPNTRDKREDTQEGGSRVYVRISKDGLDEIEHYTTADSNGEVEFNIDDKYIDAKIIIRITHRWYKITSLVDIVPKYGYFYSAKIQHDFGYWSSSPSTDPEWKTEAEYLKAAKKRNHLVRQFRFKNRIIRFFYFTILFGAPITGYFLTGIYGVGFGLAIALILELLGPYSIGLKRLF
jgi:hypothetical protein